MIKSCLECGKEFKGKPIRKFCSRSCSAIYNNKKYPRRGYTEDIKLQARKLREEKKYSYKMIANELNISTSTVINWTSDIKVNRIETQILALNQKKKPFTELLSCVAIRRRILKMRGEQCELCGLEKWQGIPITFEIHHIDGNKRNNSLENLLVLCPNCHSQTDNYRNNKVC